MARSRCRDGRYFTVGPPGFRGATLTLGTSVDTSRDTRPRAGSPGPAQLTDSYQLAIVGAIHRISSEKNEVLVSFQRLNIGRFLVQTNFYPLLENGDAWPSPGLPLHSCLAGQPPHPLAGVMQSAASTPATPTPRHLMTPAWPCSTHAMRQRESPAF